MIALRRADAEEGREVYDPLPLDTVLHGDALAELRKMLDNAVDAIIVDPPCGIAFMGKDWDNFNGKGPSQVKSPFMQNMAERRENHEGWSPSYFVGRGQTVKESTKARDAFVSFLTETMAEALRVLKPGGHALVWALPRTAHWTATAVEDAGFEVRDVISHYFASDDLAQRFLGSLTAEQCAALEALLDAQEPGVLAHLFGSGFPKSLDVSKAIDRAAGAEREVIGPKMRPDGKTQLETIPNGYVGKHEGWMRPWMSDPEHVKLQASVTAPATPAAQQWQGFGTALKPAAEFWLLARKPLSEKSVAANVQRWGTGALNIDAARVGSESTLRSDFATDDGEDRRTFGSPSGRWPANVVFSHSLWCSAGQCSPGCPVAALDAQSGVSTSTAARYFQQFSPSLEQDDEIGAGPGAPFYYAAKASRAERNKGCEELPEHKRVAHRIGEDGKITPKSTPAPGGNSHPTVKSQLLMRYLVRLACPPGGIVLDFFCGSGSTLVAAIAEGMHCIGVEMNDTEAEPYVRIARARLAQALRDAGRSEEVCPCL